MRARLMAWLQRRLWPIPTCAHEWEYVGARWPFTGYIERCQKCGEIVQVVQ